MMQFDRRTVLGILASLAGSTAFAADSNTDDTRTLSGKVTDFDGPQLGKAEPFSVSGLEQRAKAMASKAYQPRKQVPKAWRDLTYDQYRHYWFNTRQALWNNSDLPLRVDFFHPGLYFPRAVNINVVDGVQARKIRFDLDLFARTKEAVKLPIDDSLGFSGFRFRSELEKEGIFQEWSVFQGASYFRCLGRGQNYGLSARGLALNTAKGQGEEFPEFTDYWIEKPKPGSREATVHALMDSKSVVGVYTFMLVPDDLTIVDVTAVLYPRVELDHVGLGPLTSMFLFDETNTSRFDDFRPAVHDSDGLAVFNGAGERIWRPLANPKKLQVSSFVDNNPRGFGLMQRSRKFADFVDLEVAYHNRPSLWIEPKGNWGKGSVTLVEIPADREIYDNIVAYWRPRQPIPAGGEYRFAYRMSWGKEPFVETPVSHVLNTRSGTRFGGGRIFAIDFSPHAILPPDLADISLHIGSNRGSVSKGILQRNPDTGGPRLSFTLKEGDATAVEMRAQLRHEGRAVSEVWLYRWTA
ncbi:MAG: glucan biosynthesis protein G [Pseudomonadota bacterium]